MKIYGQPAKLLDNLSAADCAGGHRHRHQHPSALRSLRMEYRARQERQDCSDISAREVLRARGRVAVRGHPSERDGISYISDNYDPLVESGQMTLLKGGEEIVPGISVQTFPGHTAHMQAIVIQSRSQIPTSRQKREKGGAPPDCVLHLRSDPDDGAHRPDLGHGLRSVSAGDDREQEAVLRAGDSGEVADRFHARSENAVGVCGEGRVGEDGGEEACQTLLDGRPQRNSGKEF